MPVVIKFLKLRHTRLVPDSYRKSLFRASYLVNEKRKPKNVKEPIKGHWQPKFLLLISIRYTYGIFNFIFWPVCRV